VEHRGLRPAAGPAIASSDTAGHTWERTLLPDGVSVEAVGAPRTAPLGRTVFGDTHPAHVRPGQPFVSLQLGHAGTYSPTITPSIVPTTLPLAPLFVGLPALNR